MRAFFKSRKDLIFLAPFLFLIFSCSLGGSSGTSTTPVITQCIIPADQSATISGHWPTTPIPLAFHQGDFSASEISAFTKAADTWNEHYKAALGIPTILDYGGASPRNSNAADTTQGGSFCSSGIMSGNTFSGQVVIYKLGVWPSSYPAAAIAITNFCPIAAKPYPTFYQAVLEINYQGFFVPGTKVPDLQSIALHEFGHLLGLRHSCEGTATTGMPGCNDSKISADYVIASMFPIFTFDQSGAGQIKQGLGVNDQGRANCLYTAPQ
jgi:hypothetical protein